MCVWKSIKTAPKDGRTILVGLWLEEGWWAYREIARRIPFEEGAWTEENGNRRKITSANFWCEMPDDPRGEEK